MFNDRKHTMRYRPFHVDAHVATDLRKLQRRRLTIEAWLEMILIVAVGVLTYVVLVGP